MSRTEALLVAFDAQPSIREAGSNLERLVRRGIVDQNHLDVVAGLRERAGERLGQQLCAIVRRDADAYTNVRQVRVESKENL